MNKLNDDEIEGAGRGGDRIYRVIQVDSVINSIWDENQWFVWEGDGNLASYRPCCQ